MIVLAGDGVDLWSERFAASDGTLFIQPVTDEVDINGKILAYLPDGTERTVWRALTAGITTVFLSPQLLVGPREPSGASLR